MAFNNGLVDLDCVSRSKLVLVSLEMNLVYQ